MIISMMRHMGSALKKRKLNPLGREEVLTLMTEICQHRMVSYLLILWFLMTFIMIFGHEMVA